MAALGVNRSTARELLRPEVLSHLKNLDLVARSVVEGFLIGLHRSPKFGFSQEFAEYRNYAEGDDPRFIDWNVFARSERMVVKRFLGETNSHLMILLDASASMGFGGTGDEIVAMREGWLTASVLRSIDDSGVAVADAFVAHSKGQPVQEVWGGPFVMIDKDSDADALVEHANRYSKPKMGR